MSWSFFQFSSALQAGRERRTHSCVGCSRVRCRDNQCRRSSPVIGIPAEDRTPWESRHRNQSAHVSHSLSFANFCMQPILKRASAGDSRRLGDKVSLFLPAAREIFFVRRILLMQLLHIWLANQIWPPPGTNGHNFQWSGTFLCLIDPKTVRDASIYFRQAFFMLGSK